MILYHAPSSYYSMIARYALLEAGVHYDDRRMDIHFAKEQLSSWYRAINPAMTVPSLVEDAGILHSSIDILRYAAAEAKDHWLDADSFCAKRIEAVVYAHYELVIEQLTFGKALEKFPPLRFIVPKMLRNILHQLEKERVQSPEAKDLTAKIKQNQARLDYFTQGHRLDKLNAEREHVRHFLQQLPTPEQCLFGERPSSADIVTVVLFGRLQMIGEYNLVSKDSPLRAWFLRMQSRPAYQKADIWTRFQVLRCLLNR